MSYVVKSITSISLSHIGITIILTSLSYAALTGYDYLAAPHINQPYHTNRLPGLLLSARPSATLQDIIF
jgi:uncharacterized membrane protein YbhN (UPF0104 family)